MTRGYIPDAGDIVWLQFSPQSGHRPALVLSPASYNAKTGLMVCCGLTTRIKGYPFEVPLASQPGSVVLADQLKSLDWRSRGAKRKGRASDTELARVRLLASALIGSEKR